MDPFEFGILVVGWCGWVLLRTLEAIWFPLVVVGGLCLFERLLGRLKRPRLAFGLALFFSPALPATNFHLLGARLVGTNWLVFGAGMFAGILLLLVHKSKMDLRQRSGHLSVVPKTV